MLAPGRSSKAESPSSQGCFLELEKDEYVEQAYFFRMIRDRLDQGLSTQEILGSLDQELLSTTRLPMAVQFLKTELKHTGHLSKGFDRLAHYFTPFQAHVVRSAENDKLKFSLTNALAVLQKEAEYRSGTPTVSGLFVYHFEVLARNRLGYDDGLKAMSQDWFYPPDWQRFLSDARHQLGIVEFADLIYLRSEWYLKEQRRTYPDYEPSLPSLFGEKEGKIAKANRSRDPLYLFSALQRQLGYPEVPRSSDEVKEQTLLQQLQLRIRDLEGKVRLLEAENREQVDLTKFARPEFLEDD